MSLKIKRDGFSVEIETWDFETMDAEAIVNPTDSIFSGSGGLDGAIHKRAGNELDRACEGFGKLEDGKAVVTEGYQLPVKKIVHVAVPSYKPGRENVMEQCYYSAIRAVCFGENKCRSMIIPLLGIGSRGWDPEDSMRCAWKAILRCAEETAAGFFGQDRLRKIVIACNQKAYDQVKVYRKNMGHLFLKTPEQWCHHGDLFLWDYLKWRLAEYKITQAIPSAVSVLRIIAKIVVELTDYPLEKGKTLFVKNDEQLGKLSGFPIHCDFWLDIALPLLLENLCDHYEELGLPPMETSEILIGNHRWTIPNECEYFFNLMRGKDNKVFVIKTVPAEEKKLTLKEVGLKYSPAVEQALKICFDAHKDQKDNSGLPYVFHPFHLAEQMDTEDEICVALLHDVVEDSPYSLEDLRKAGFDETVTDAVARLTHDPNIPYMDYIRVIRKNKVARKVKLADLIHNSDPRRKAIETGWEKKRAGKYRIAKAILEDDWYDHYMGYYRKRIPLDDKRLYFLSVFYDLDGIVNKYSLDVEAAADSHIEFGSEAIPVIKKTLGCRCSFPEALFEYFEDHSDWDFRMLLTQCKVEYKEFHYGD